MTLLVDNGTAGAAELFASALSGNGRATLVGEHTIGRAATQELVKLPDGSALWLSTARYLTPKDVVLHEKGLAPDVPVDVPDVEFGAAAADERSDPRQSDRPPLREEASRVESSAARDARRARRSAEDPRKIALSA